MMQALAVIAQPVPLASTVQFRLQGINIKGQVWLHDLARGGKITCIPPVSFHLSSKISFLGACQNWYFPIPHSGVDRLIYTHFVWNFWVLYVLIGLDLNKMRSPGAMIASSNHEY